LALQVLAQFAAKEHSIENIRFLCEVASYKMLWRSSGSPIDDEGLPRTRSFTSPCSDDDQLTLDAPDSEAKSEKLQMIRASSLSSGITPPSIDSLRPSQEKKSHRTSKACEKAKRGSIKDLKMKKFHQQCAAIGGIIANYMTSISTHEVCLPPHITKKIFRRVGVDPKQMIKAWEESNGSLNESMVSERYSVRNPRIQLAMMELKQNIVKHLTKKLSDMKKKPNLNHIFDEAGNHLTKTVTRDTLKRCRRQCAINLKVLGPPKGESKKRKGSRGSRR